MAVRYLDITHQALTSVGVAIPGAKLNFYETGTSTPLDTYSDDGLTTANANPVVADSAGRFGDMFLKAQDYKVVYTTADDVTIVTQDPVHGESLADLLSAAKKTSIAAWFPGKPTSSAIIFGYVFDRAVTLPEDLGTSAGHGLIAPSDGAIVYTITRNGASVGTVNWANGQNAATFTFAAAVAYVVGDYLTVTAPGTVDSTHGDLMITLQGTRP